MIGEIVVRTLHLHYPISCQKRFFSESVLVEGWDGCVNTVPTMILEWHNSEAVNTHYSYCTQLVVKTGFQCVSASRRVGWVCEHSTHKHELQWLNPEAVNTHYTYWNKTTYLRG